MVPLRHHHKVTTAVDTRITWTIFDDLILHIEYVLLLSLVLALFVLLLSVCFALSFLCGSNWFSRISSLLQLQ